MDYVEFCGRILAALKAEEDANRNARWIGVQRDSLLGRLSIAALPKGWSEGQRALDDAYREMLRFEFIAPGPAGEYGLLTRTARDYLADPLPMWKAICRTRIEQDEEAVLRALARLSERCADDHATVEMVENPVLLDELGWSSDRHGRDRLETAVRSLREIGYADRPRFAESAHLAARATFLGLVWGTRRGPAIEWELLDGLVDEWETATVDFKRELGLETKDQRAEFVKDVIALANTQASGRRWLVVGFDPKSRTYHDPPNEEESRKHREHLLSIDQDRLLQLLAVYVTPAVEVRVSRVDYRFGPVAVVEILRDRRMVPYRVKKALVGAKRSLALGQSFVRAGSITIQVDDEIVASLEAEAAYATAADAQREGR